MKSSTNCGIGCRTPFGRWLLRGKLRVLVCFSGGAGTSYGLPCRVV